MRIEPNGSWRRGRVASNVCRQNRSYACSSQGSESGWMRASLPRCLKCQRPTDGTLALPACVATKSMADWRCFYAQTPPNDSNNKDVALIIEVRVISHVLCVILLAAWLLPISHILVTNSDACRFCIVCILDSIALKCLLWHAA